MTAYRQYWLFTGFLLIAAIYALYMGVVSWALVKFPELQGQVVTAGVIVVFLYTYAVHGHGAAKLLSDNERALTHIQNGAPRNSFFGSDVVAALEKTRWLHHAGSEQGHHDFSTLYELMVEQFENRMLARMGQIDTVRVFLFFAGLLFTVVGIVQGFASQQFPTNPEEAKIFSFTIIKALGLSYLPATECLTGTLILYVLSNALQTQAASLTERFNDVLYQVAFFGDIIAGKSPASDTVLLAGGLPHAQTT